VGPLLLFSTLNPTMADNAVTGATMSLAVETLESAYVLPSSDSSQHSITP
jgi:hypothetical protein